MANNDQIEFVLEDWLKEYGLSKKTSTTLKKEECDNLAALRLLTCRDVNRMNIAVGQSRLLRVALRAMGNPISVDDSNSKEKPKEKESAGEGDSSANGKALEGAGEELAQILDGVEQGEYRPINAGGELAQILRGEGDIGQATGGGQMGEQGQRGGDGTGNGLCDPLMLLTVKSTTKKALQIINFLPEAVRNRVNRRKKENITLSTLADGGLTLKSDDQGTYYATFDEWSGANMRLGAHLLKTGQISADKLVYYMAYTAMISDLASKYEWSSVLEFDSRYRELQAEHEFLWGTQHSHTERHILIPRGTNSYSKGKLGRGGSGNDRLEGKPRALCKLYLSRGWCKFGDRCIYRHEQQNPEEKGNAQTKNE